MSIMGDSSQKTWGVTHLLQRLPFLIESSAKKHLGCHETLPQKNKRGGRFYGSKPGRSERHRQGGSSWCHSTAWCRRCQVSGRVAETFASDFDHHGKHNVLFVLFLIWTFWGVFVWLFMSYVKYYDTCADVYILLYMCTVLWHDIYIYIYRNLYRIWWLICTEARVWWFRNPARKQRMYKALRK